MKESSKFNHKTLSDKSWVLNIYMCYCDHSFSPQMAGLLNCTDRNRGSPMYESKTKIKVIFLAENGKAILYFASKLTNQITRLRYCYIICPTFCKAKKYMYGFIFCVPHVV